MNICSLTRCTTNSSQPTPNSIQLKLFGYLCTTILFVPCPRNSSLIVSSQSVCWIWQDWPQHSASSSFIGSCSLLVFILFVRTAYSSSRSDRSLYCTSAPDLASGVPRGSVLRILLFVMYTTPLSELIFSTSANYHFYADNTHCFSPHLERMTPSSANVLSLLSST